MVSELGYLHQRSQHVKRLLWRLIRSTGRPISGLQSLFSSTEISASSFLLFEHQNQFFCKRISILHSVTWLFCQPDQQWGPISDKRSHQQAAPSGSPIILGFLSIFSKFISFIRSVIYPFFFWIDSLSRQFSFFLIRITSKYWIRLVLLPIGQKIHLDDNLEDRLVHKSLCEKLWSF